MSKKSLVCGVGVNDANYKVKKIIDGVKTECPFYTRWKSMISRCYSENRMEKYPTYADCQVSREWLIFSEFKQWMSRQDWQGNHLDKDLLFIGNKIYSPKTCVFINPSINMLTTEHTAARGDWPLGVYLHKATGKFASKCNNPFTAKQEWLGLFNCPEMAHQAWKSKKHEHALKLADLQTDPRVAQALRTRYL